MRLFAQTKYCYSVFTKQVASLRLLRYLVSFYKEVQPYVAAHVRVLSAALASTPPFFKRYIAKEVQNLTVEFLGRILWSFPTLRRYLPLPLRMPYRSFVPLSSHF
jgi:hypothetical protein